MLESWYIESGLFSCHSRVTVRDIFFVNQTFLGQNVLTEIYTKKSNSKNAAK